MRVPVVRDTADGWLGRVLALEGHRAPETASLSSSDLREALAGAHIQTRYQPIVSMADRRPVGLEVLVRLHHPTLGILPPDLFVPKIEQAGLAWQLTEVVVRRAFEEWNGAALDRLSLVIALNFPLDVLLVHDALVLLEEQRQLAGIPASRIVIELTESRPVEQLQALRRAIGRLRDQGYGLAIDDVGPELRDHQALLDLKFTALKLDKDLVTRITRERQRSGIPRACDRLSPRCKPHDRCGGRRGCGDLGPHGRIGS